MVVGWGKNIYELEDCNGSQNDVTVSNEKRGSEDGDKWMNLRDIQDKKFKDKTIRTIWDLLNI